jgi:hypothetical protein
MNPLGRPTAAWLGANVAPLAALLVGLPLLVGCGGEDDSERPAASQGAHATAAATDRCAAADGYELEPIIDFENAHTANFWFSTDGTETEIEPEPQNNPPPAELDTPRCGTSHYALHILARGLSKYGGAFGMSYDYNSPKDASDWDGIALWVRRAPSTGLSLFVGVNEKHTDEQGSMAAFGEAFCLNDAPAEQDKCDRFGAGVALDEDWHFVALRFDQMHQRGFGVVAPYLDVAAIQGLNIGFEIGDWEFWVDDLAYFREPPEE